MNSSNSNGGRNRAPSPISFDPTGGLVGQIRSGASATDLLAQLAVRAARLPLQTGLIGGQYARYMAQHLPPTLRALGGGLSRSGAAAPDPTIAPTTRPAPVPVRRAPAPAAPNPRAPTVLQEVRTDAADIEARQAAALRKIMIKEEGLRDDVYLDTRQVPTVGIGHKVRASDRLKVGDRVSQDQIEQFYQQDTAAALRAARAQAAEAGITDSNLIAPLASVNFQLGPGWKDEHKKTWELIQHGDYAAAAEEAARSKWAKQTPRRVRAFQEALRGLPPRGSATD